MRFGQFWHEDEKFAGSGKAYEEEMEGLTIERLGLKDVAQAFPLIQLKHKALTIAQWTTYVQRITDTDGGIHRGILAARNDQGVIYGMLQYEVRCNVEGYCQMGAANLVACGLFQEQSVQLTAAMVKTLEQMALELGCQRVLIVVPENSNPDIVRRLASILEASGHRLTNTTFSKNIESSQGKKVKSSDRASESGRRNGTA
jgi:hypothetical protein